MNKLTVLIFSFLLAFCSLFYELVYAQILSVCIGGTKTQYLITISLFTSALGLGSLVFKYFFDSHSPRKLLFNIELLLVVLGSLGPFLITWLLEGSSDSAFLQNLKVTFSYFFIFLIGLLSGFELPCLFKLQDNAHGSILAADYAGMLAASLLFPFVFLPELGTAASTLFVANINVVALIWLKGESFSKRITPVLVLSNVVVFGLIVFYRAELNGSLTSLYLGAP